MQFATRIDKLKANRTNPWKFDNSELLKNAPSEIIRQKTIQGH